MSVLPDIAPKHMPPPPGSCPYLWLASDPSLRLAYADSGHRCFAQVNAPEYRPDNEFQESHCLTDRYVHCPRYQPPTSNLPADPGAFSKTPVKPARSPLHVAAWVYGDGSGLFLNAWIQDRRLAGLPAPLWMKTAGLGRRPARAVMMGYFQSSQGEVRQFPMGRILHTDSWQLMVSTLEPAAPWPQVHISGPDNGVVDYPVSLYGLVLDAEGSPAKSGQIFIDELTLGVAAVPPVAGGTAATPASPEATPTSSPPAEAISGDSAAFSSTIADGKERVYVQWDLTQQEEPALVKVGDADVFGRNPTWMDNGRIAYTGCNYWAEGSQYGLWAVTADNSAEPYRLTDQADDVSSDSFGGNLLYQSRATGNWDVYIVPAGGGTLRNLTNSPSQDSGATFSPNGRSVAFMSDRDGSWGIWVIDIDGSNPQKVLAVPGGFGADWPNERLSWSN